MPVELSVIIPAYNEEARLGETLRRISEYLDDHERSYEVLVVDDGSEDQTTGVAQQFSSKRLRLCHHETNRGKGAAVRTGVLASQGEWVLISDADLSTPIEELERLEDRTNEIEIVMGSRALADSRILQRQPFYREFMGKIFNRIIRLLGLVGLHDTQCGFKLIKGDVARELFEQMSVERFAFDVELIWLAQRAGYGVAEVGVSWIDSPSSRVHPITDSLSMLWDVVRLRFRQ